MPYADPIKAAEYSKAYRAKNRATLLAAKKAWWTSHATPTYMLARIEKTRLKEHATRSGGLCTRKGNCSNVAAEGHWYCNECLLASRERHYITRYGMSLSDRDAMLIAQGGQCYICDRTDTSAWHLDHDHRYKTQDKRGHLGIACHSCNVGKGHFGDDPDKMEQAAHRIRSRMLALALAEVA